MDLHRIDLNLLVSLDILLAECNVTRAARRLALSQPALSAQLKQLRAHFDDPLLLPTARGMTPTARALDLQEPLRAWLGAAHALLAARQPFDPATAERTFRIASSDAIHNSVSVPLAARLRKLAPNCRLALLPADRHRLEEQMSAGEIDLALVTPQAMPPSLKVRSIYEEQFLCVMRRGHPLAGVPLDLDAFCAQDHLLVSTSGGGFAGAVDAALAKVGRQRRVVFSVTSFLLVPSLLAETDLLSTVPARLARRWADSLAVLAPPLDLAGFSIHMGWHPRSHADPALIWLREHALAAGEAPFPPSESVVPNRRGIVAWLTGLPGSGKTTVAQGVAQTLREKGRRVVVLDGDELRRGLCADLGFSLADRAENIRRVSELARLFLDEGAVVLVALVSPLQHARDAVRRSFAERDYAEVYCDAPFGVCRARDPKGLYARAERGDIPEFTGVSSPYEVPVDPALVLHTGAEPAPASIARLSLFLRERLR